MTTKGGFLYYISTMKTINLTVEEIADVLLVYNDAVSSGIFSPEDFTPEEFIFEVQLELDQQTAS